MSKKLIVITKNGFLTSKEEKEVLKTDTILSEAKDEQDAEKQIHGGYRKQS